MSLYTAQKKLQDDFRTLMAVWHSVREVWDDESAHRFEREVIDQIEPLVRSTVSEIDEMRDFVAEAREACR